MELIYTTTEDKLILPGAHYSSDKKDLCVVFVHGMSGNILENIHANVLGQTLIINNIGFLYGHNRGHSHINDIAIAGTTTSRRIGATYERFEESIFDIDAWTKSATDLGYSKVILAGHSLGGPKVIHYISKKSPFSVTGVILASPADMVALFEKDEPSHSEILETANKNISQGKPLEIIPYKIWDWYYLSSQTMVDLFTRGGPADILPEISSITQPILALYGENDDSFIKSVQEDLDDLKNMATNCKSFTTKIIPGANHTYDGKEAEFSEVILNWIKFFLK
ncbi:MAG: hypothetical protein UU93_C0001G0046 [Candidatus Amesbacteria bacterium GW2011_GWA2_42_12]|uniref:Serine aminopeptidase S33 domain-containing protein n=1 Tax=Candidatus Amesbacteria bacterium GW2011_GWA2_42_12 TaxID=1618356 RepID=A0A0G0Y927_9BACT|nr:MAG: hypothetical protein UU93_C0001G0046 [Candidatus Amesbacteria bacterium GW2011_GWA2_42_12]